MHSYIIATDSKITDHLDIIAKTLKLDSLTIKNNPDITIIGGDDQTIKIEQIRQLKQVSLRSPIQNTYTIIVIQQAEKMTIQSQNALLKLLEEPFPHTKIFLATRNINSLLPTIHSRCQIIKSKSKKENKINENDFLEISRQPLTKRLASIESYTKDRDKAIKWIKSAIYTCHQALISQDDIPASTYIHNLQTAHNDLQGNLNIKLTMDNLVLNLER